MTSRLHIVYRGLGPFDPESRQTEFDRNRAAKGLCKCGKPAKKSLCPECLAVQAERMRERRAA